MSKEIFKLLRTKTVREKSIMCTELIGNQQGDKSNWLRDVINVRRKLKGQEPVKSNRTSSDNMTIKSGAVEMLISYLESDV